MDPIQLPPVLPQPEAGLKQENRRKTTFPSLKLMACFARLSCDKRPFETSLMSTPQLMEKTRGSEQLQTPRASFLGSCDPSEAEIGIKKEAANDVYDFSPSKERLFEGYLERATNQIETIKHRLFQIRCTKNFHQSLNKVFPLETESLVKRASDASVSYESISQEAERLEQFIAVIKPLTQKRGVALREKIAQENLRCLLNRELRLLVRGYPSLPLSIPPLFKLERRRQTAFHTIDLFIEEPEFFSLLSKELRALRAKIEAFQAALALIDKAAQESRLSSSALWEVVIDEEKKGLATIKKSLQWLDEALDVKMAKLIQERAIHTEGKSVSAWATQIFCMEEEIEKIETTLNEKKKKTARLPTCFLPDSMKRELLCDIFTVFEAFDLKKRWELFQEDKTNPHEREIIKEKTKAVHALINKVKIENSAKNSMHLERHRVLIETSMQYIEKEGRILIHKLHSGQIK